MFERAVLTKLTKEGFCQFCQCGPHRLSEKTKGLNMNWLDPLVR